MELKIKNAMPTQELLRNYSCRRLQFAIKMGLLPTPENYSQLLKMQNNQRIRNAHPSKYWKEGRNLRNAEAAESEVETQLAATTNQK